MSNQISIIGRLGRDSERKAVGDNHVLEFSVACDTGYGDKKTTTWFKVAYWQKSDKLVDYLVKGTQVWVAGECSLREYTGKEGDKKTSLEVRANAIQLIGGKGDSTNHETDRGATPQPNSGALPPPNNPVTDDHGELPF